MAVFLKPADAHTVFSHKSTIFAGVINNTVNNEYA